MASHPTHDLEKQPSLTLSPEQWKSFERAYLTPAQGATPNPQRRALGNPTILGIAALTLTLFPLSINMLGWGNNAPAGNLTLTPSCYFTSGIGLLLAAVGEFVVGNTFPLVVFGTLAGFTLSLGAQNDPQFALAGAALLGANGQPATGEAAAAALVIYQSGMGIWLITWSAWLYILTWFARRVNLVFCFAFSMVSTCILTYGASLFVLANLHLDAGTKLVKAAGGFAFVACLLAFWLLISMLDVATGGRGLPVGDCSNGAPWRKKTRTETASLSASASTSKES